MLLLTAGAQALLQAAHLTVVPEALTRAYTALPTPTTAENEAKFDASFAPPQDAADTLEAIVSSEVTQYAVMVRPSLFALFG